MPLCQDIKIENFLLVCQFCITVLKLNFKKTNFLFKLFIIFFPVLYTICIK